MKVVFFETPYLALLFYLLNFLKLLRGISWRFGKVGLDIQTNLSVYRACLSSKKIRIFGFGNIGYNWRYYYTRTKLISACTQLGLGPGKAHRDSRLAELYFLVQSGLRLSIRPGLLAVVQLKGFSAS